MILVVFVNLSIWGTFSVGSVFNIARRHLKEEKLILIREAIEEDAEPLAKLATELGYKTTKDDVAKRFNKLKIKVKMFGRLKIKIR